MHALNALTERQSMALCSAKLATLQAIPKNWQKQRVNPEDQLCTECAPCATQAPASTPVSLRSAVSASAGAPNSSPSVLEPRPPASKHTVCTSLHIQHHSQWAGHHGLQLPTSRRNTYCKNLAPFGPHSRLSYITSKSRRPCRVPDTVKRENGTEKPKTERRP